MITRRTRASRVTLLAAVPLLALVTLAAGCGTVTTPPSGTGGTTTSAAPTQATGTPVTGTPVPTTTGGSVTPGQPACTGWPATVAREALPASFIPVTVLRCVTSYQMIPGKGQWLTATLERADKNLGALVTALRLPSERTRPGVMCPAIAMLPPQIVLINGDGKMITPQLPLSGCGLVRTQVLAALAALPWQKVSVRLVSQVQTQPEVASGCAPEYKDPFVVYGSPRPSAGGPVYTATPASLRICVYSSGGATSAAQFLRGTTVTGSAVSDLLAGLSGARRTSLCTLPHSTFAVVGGESPGSPFVYVELGGCDRVFRYESGTTGLVGMSTGQATPGAVAIIESVTRPKP